MWLLERLTPDFKTIADFRKNNGKGIKNACRAFIDLCRQMQIFTDVVVAIDGSKFKSVNSKSNNFTPQKTKGHIGRVEQSIALYPTTIRTDQGPGFSCCALDQWAFEHDVEMCLIQPGKQTQNGFIESFNGRFRDEGLNEDRFSDIVHGRKMINEWRQDYNECRPHSSLNYQTPAEFAADWRNGKNEEKPTDMTN